MRNVAVALLVIPLVFIVGMAIHELVHVLAVIALGGDVIEVRLLPTIIDGRLVLGHVLHDGVGSPAMVAAAPTAFWLVVATTATVVARRLSRHKRMSKMASLITIAFVIAPLLDVSASVGGLVLGSNVADHAIAFAHVEPLVNAMAVLIFLVFATTSRQTLLAWRPGLVSQTGYSVGFGVLMLSAWSIHLV